MANEGGSFSVSSEVGKLKRVMLHRPGKELERLTIDNKDELLFDDILWLEEAQRSTTPLPTSFGITGWRWFTSEIVFPMYLGKTLSGTLSSTKCSPLRLSTSPWSRPSRVFSWK